MAGHRPSHLAQPDYADATDDAAHALTLPDAPQDLGAVDITRLTEASEGCTGADLRRVVEDGKALYAVDRARDRPPKSLTDYLLAALATLRQDKQTYARARLRQKFPPLA